MKGQERQSAPYTRGAIPPAATGWQGQTLTTWERAEPGPPQALTSEAGHLLALGLAEERQLIGDGLQHFDKVWQEEDDLDIMVG